MNRLRKRAIPGIVHGRLFNDAIVLQLIAIAASL